MGNTNTTYALSKSKEIANNQILKKFSSDCNFSCKKVIDGKQIKLGKEGRKFTIQKNCTVNGTCMMNAAIGALANVEFVASSSSNAKEASKGKIGFPGEINPLISRSRQELNTTISQTAIDMCNIENTNNISKVYILTTRRKFDGPVALVQDVTMKSDCMISRALAASALATMTADNTATRGKDKKGLKMTLLIAIVAIVSGSVLSGITILKQKKKN